MSFLLITTEQGRQVKAAGILSKSSCRAPHTACYLERRHGVGGLQPPRPEQHKRCGPGGVQPLEQVCGCQQRGVVPLSLRFIAREMAHGAWNKAERGNLQPRSCLPSPRKADAAKEALTAKLVCGSRSLPRSFPLKAALLRCWTRLETSPKPMLTPCPASGWTLWAASLGRKRSSAAASRCAEGSSPTPCMILPNECHSRPNVLSSMSPAKGKQHSAFGIHPGHAWGQLACRDPGRPQKGKSMLQQGTSGVNQVCVVSIAPLSSTAKKKQDEK